MQKYILRDEDFLELLTSYDTLLSEGIGYGIFNTR